MVPAPAEPWLSLGAGSLAPVQLPVSLPLSPVCRSQLYKLLKKIQKHSLWLDSTRGYQRGHGDNEPQRSHRLYFIKVKRLEALRDSIEHRPQQRLHQCFWNGVYPQHTQDPQDRVILRIYLSSKPPRSRGERRQRSSATRTTGDKLVTEVHLLGELTILNSVRQGAM